MNGVTDNLMALQLLQLKKSPSNQQVATLRAKIPESYLQTFDRLFSRKKRPVSVVHHGVCSECHLCIPIGTVGMLAHAGAVQTCGNCGRFLYQPADE